MWLPWYKKGTGQRSRVKLSKDRLIFKVYRVTMATGVNTHVVKVQNAVLFSVAFMNEGV